LLGIFGEMLIELIYENMGKHVQPGKGGYDCLANRAKVEVKTSFISLDNRYTFCQIRPNSDFDKIVFVFISPEGIEFYQAKKETIIDAIKRGNLTSTHNDHSGVNTKLYIIKDTKEGIVKRLKLRNITNILSRFYTQKNIRDLANNMVSNRIELRKHMVGSKFEDISYAPSRAISTFGKNIAKRVLKNCNIPARIKESNKTTRDGKPLFIVRTSFITVDGGHTICQIRPDEDFDNMVFVAVEPDDIYLYMCTKQDVIDSIEDLTKQHNNGKRKSKLFIKNGSRRTIVKTLNMKEI
jgi:hypothetical protein